MIRGYEFIPERWNIVAEVDVFGHPSRSSVPVWSRGTKEKQRRVTWGIFRHQSGDTGRALEERCILGVRQRRGACVLHACLGGLKSEPQNDAALRTIRGSNHTHITIVESEKPTLRTWRSSLRYSRTVPGDMRYSNCLRKTRTPSNRINGLEADRMVRRGDVWRFWANDVS